MKRGGGLALAVVACAVLIGQGKPKELPDLVAKSLTIKSPGNKAGVFIGIVDKLGPLIRIHDATGRRVLLSSSNGLFFRSPNDKQTLILSENGLFVRNPVESVTITTESVVLHRRKKLRAVMGSIPEPGGGVNMASMPPEGLLFYTSRGQKIGVEVPRGGEVVWHSLDASPKK